MNNNMEKSIRIGPFNIGPDHAPFIIAEAGINHNGNLDKALTMISVAKKAEANAIKYQTFKAEQFVLDSKLTITYRSQGKEITESQLEMFKRHEFSKEAWFEIKAECDRQDILFLSTPQNRSDLDLLLEIGVPAIKVGSDDFTNIPLIKSYSETGLPLILSCGMSNLAEIYSSLEAVGSLDGYPTVLLLCTSQYPTPLKDVNLLKLKTLRSTFPMLVHGFSDHTQGPLASSVAAALGACFFEKHFTLNHNDAGPDHWFSEDPKGLMEWVKSIQNVYDILGSGIVRPTHQEEKEKLGGRRSIVAIKNIIKGERFSLENIGLRRPGTGLPPVLIGKFLQAKSSRIINKGEMLKYKDLS